MRTLRRIGKALGWLAAGVLALVLALGAELGLLLGTDFGRERLRRLAVEVTDELLPGRVAVGEIARLDPWGAELRDVVLYDPRGQEVARIARIRVGLDPLALGEGRLHIPFVALEGVSADLRELERADRGLLAAVMDVNAPPEPDEPDSGEPLRIDIDRVSLRDGAVEAAVPGDGAVPEEIQVRALALDGGFHMQRTMQVEVAKLGGELQARGRTLKLGPIAGLYRDDGQPSRIELQATTGGTRVTLRAEAVAPFEQTGQPGASPLAKPHTETPVAAELTVEGVDRTLLAAVGVNDPSIGEPLSARVELSGTLLALTARTTLQSPGGELKADATLDQLDVLKLDLETQGLDLQRVYATLPPKRVAFQVRAETCIKDLPDAAPLLLEIERATLDGEALPTLRAKAELRERTLHVASLQLAGHGVQLQLAGRYGLDTQVVAVEGRATGRDVKYEDVSVRQLDMELGAHGKLPYPKLHVKLDARDVRSGDTHVHELGVALDGGPEDYVLALNARIDEDKIAVSGELHKRPRELELSLHGDGELRGHPFSLGVRELRVGTDGSVSVPWLTVSVLGQHVQLEARRSKKGELAVALNAHALDLAEIAAALGVTPAPTGQLDLRLNAEGTPERPVVALHLEGRDVGLPAQNEKPELRFQVLADAHYAPGEITLSMRADDPVGAWLSLAAAVQPRAQTVSALVAELPELLHRAGWQLDLALAERALERFGALVEVPAELRAATVGADITAKHAPLAEPEVELTVLATVPAYGEPSERCHPPATSAQVTARLLGGKLTLEVHGKAAARELLALRAEAALPLAPTLQRFEAPVLLGVGYTLDIHELDLEQVPIACGQVYGTLGLQSTGKDLLGSYPELQAKLRGQRIGLSAVERIDVQLDAKLDGKGLLADGTLSHEKRTSTLTLRVPLTLHALGVELDTAAPFSAELRLDRLPLGPLVGPGMPVSRVSGTLAGVVRARGTLDAPSLQGSLALAKTRLTANALAQPLRDVGGRFDFTERQVRVRELCAHDRGGEVCVDGTLLLPREGKAEADFHVHVDEFPLRQQGQVVANANLEATVKVRTDPEAAHVRLAVKDVDMWLRGGQVRRGQGLEPHPDVVDPRALPDVEAEPELPEDKRVVYMVLDATDQFWVKRDDFAVKLSTRLELRIEPEVVNVVGVVEINRGYLQLLGETFEIDRKSTLEFVGGSHPDPVLDIGARVTSKKSGKLVSVKITGRASEPKVSFFVDDAAATAGDAVMAIMGGESSGDEEQAVAGQAQSFAAGVMASMMAVAARRELGAAAPIIMLEPGEDVSSSRVRAGFELDSLVPKFMEKVVRGVYVEGIVAGDSGKSAVQGGVLLELYFPYSLVWAGQYGPGETWSLDLGWEP